ncbi:MAG: hypothetical protein ACKVU2_12570 [Saprospiraceae bacterium]
MKNILFQVVALCCCLSNLFSQANVVPSAETKTAIEKIRFMAGNWKGTGWIRMGPQRHEFVQTESVVEHANGTVLTIDGLGRDATNPDKIIHQAFAVISYNQAADKYLMRAIRADGNHVDADFAVNTDGSITWGFTHPMAGQVRYTIRQEAGKWVENGEMSRDGTNWVPFFEMRLERE